MSQRNRDAGRDSAGDPDGGSDPEGGSGSGVGDDPTIDAPGSDPLRALLSVDIDQTPVRRHRERAVPARRPGATRPGPSRSGRGKGASWTSALSLVVVITAGVALVLAGARIVRTSTRGELFSPVTDPAAPGFEAVVDPTPTLAVLHEIDGVLVGATVLTLPDATRGGGGVLLVPVRTLTEIVGIGAVPIELVYGTEGPRDQADVIGDVLGAAVREVTVVDRDRWAGLVDPVAPIVVDNTDALEIDGEPAFPVGTVRLDATDVGPYLAAQVPGESDLARLFRHQLFWRAWLDAVTDAGAAAVPGEVDSGIGRFVRALAAGETVIAVLPVDEIPSPDGLVPPTFAPDAAAIADLVARFVPLPQTPRPGVRPRVRLLNGTPDTSAAAGLADELPAAGVEVVLIGNAAPLDVATTTIAYVGPEHEDAARAIRAILGVGTVVQETRPSDAADITVTLGADHG